ncbi:YbaB/EbfC family nucleoid-associated protein [Luedemannella helvata]|uniref:YbaB/EbfC DNA-binding family protein n=1 Tax=Luedemannella helvata TaxID=349315 RepID=A0ABP4WSJ8_9ACTN
MPREIDERWIEEAIERYQRVEKLQAEFEQAVGGIEVTVRSPDGLVELVVAGDGKVRDVVVSESFASHTARDLSRAVKAALAAADDAAGWARAKLHQDMYGEFRPLSS